MSLSAFAVYNNLAPGHTFQVRKSQQKGNRKGKKKSTGEKNNLKNCTPPVSLNEGRRQLRSRGAKNVQKLELNVQQNKLNGGNEEKPRKMKQPKKGNILLAKANKVEKLQVNIETTNGTLTNGAVCDLGDKKRNRTKPTKVKRPSVLLSPGLNGNSVSGTVANDEACEFRIKKKNTTKADGAVCDLDDKKRNRGKPTKVKRPSVLLSPGLNGDSVSRTVTNAEACEFTFKKNTTKANKKVLVSEENGNEAVKAKKRPLVTEDSTSPVQEKRSKVVKKGGKKTKKVTENKSIWAASESEDSVEEGRSAFNWMIDPITPEQFFETVWEKKPLHISRESPGYFNKLLSTSGIDKMLREHNVQYTKNLDITSYSDGKRETHNPSGRAHPSVVWDYYSNGCSIRLLNPQTFINPVWKLNSKLQEYLGCFVGANVYLTPPGTQGFAPHYDDIEAFILQIEGQKHWRIYKPRSSQEKLPRFSSGNFSQDEIGEPVCEMTLHPGDVLYFPRGFIHQGYTTPEAHSLHITVSCYQRNSFGDLLEKIVPAALKIALEEDEEFREGLPRDYLSFTGVAHSDFASTERVSFENKIKSLMARLFTHAPIDAAVDQMGKQFMHDALPPPLSEDEKSRSVFECGERLVDGQVENRVELEPDDCIKLLRANILRLVVEEDAVRVYYCVDNSREYHADDPQFIEIPEEFGPAVEFLINSYPDYVPINQLPIDGLDRQMQIAGDLWERGLLLSETPLESLDD